MSDNYNTMDVIDDELDKLQLNDDDKMDIIDDSENKKEFINEENNKNEIINKENNKNEIVVENQENNQNEIVVENQENNQKQVENQENNKKIDEEKIYLAITNFVDCLQENFGKYFYEIKLYNLLLENTGIIHTEQRKKHVQIFTLYLNEQKLSILEQNEATLGDAKIRFSDKIFLNIPAILKEASQEDKDTIWEHLLVLLALSIPDSSADKVLGLKKPQRPSPIREDNMFGTIFNSLTEQLQNTDLNDTNPMEMVGNIMNSGIINDIFNAIPKINNDQNESIDFNSVIQNFQDVMGKMQGPIADLSTSNSLAKKK